MLYTVSVVYKFRVKSGTPMWEAFIFLAVRLPLACVSYDHYKCYKDRKHERSSDKASSAFQQSLSSNFAMWHWLICMPICSARSLYAAFLDSFLLVEFSHSVSRKQWTPCLSFLSCLFATVPRGFLYPLRSSSSWVPTWAPHPSHEYIIPLLTSISLHVVVQYPHFTFHSFPSLPFLAGFWLPFSFLSLFFDM